MDLSQRVPQTNGKLFFQITNFWPKTKKYSKEWRGVNIDQITMCYISMDSSQRLLQTTERLFKFQLSFQNFGQKPSIFKRIARRE